MKPLFFYFLALVILGMACKPQPNSETTTPTWTSLFNGENLDGWVMKIAAYDLGENYANTFRVEDGILKISYDQYERYDQRFGALYFDKSFSNYRLLVEYRFVGDTATGAPSWGYRDSGIQYHSQSPASMGKDQSFPVCLEYNIHGGNGTDERPVGQICASGTKLMIDGKPNESFCTPPQVARTFHGDQWVTAEIDIQGDSISHWVNGEKILTYTHPQYNPEHELGKTLIKGEDKSLRSGYISLQSNSHPIAFRRIEIKEY